MSDRYNALIVVLDKDIHDVDAQPTIDAIKQINHVQSVKGRKSSFHDDIAQSRVRSELISKLWEVLYPKK